MTMMRLCLLMGGLLPLALAQLSCPDGPSCSTPLCPNTIVQYMCNISVPRVFTHWTVPVQSCGGTDTTLLLLRQSTQSNCGSQSILCGLFRASNVPPVGDTPCTSSILHVNVSQELQGSLITCNSSDVSAQYLIGSAKIHVLSAPSTPHLSVTAKLNGLEAICSSGDHETYCNVTIQVNGAVQSVAANAKFNGLTSNMMYQISARAINRCGDYTETSASQWTLPEAPPTSTIKVLQSLINGSVTQLNITWNHIGGNVSQYMIKSISGMNIFTSQASVQIFCVAMSCVYSQVVKTTGIPYSITISSINDGGVGPESDPVQGQSQSNSNSTYSVGVGVGVGIPLLVIVICITAALVFIAYFRKRQSGHSYATNPGFIMDEHKERTLGGNNAEQPAPQRNEKEMQCGSVAQFSANEENQNQLPPNNRDTLQNHPSDVIPNSRRKPFERMPYCIKNPHDGTVLTIQDDRLVFKTMKYIPVDTQLWYLDDQPDNSFLIVSKMSKMVLANTKSGVNIQIRRGDNSQKWMQDSNTILSSKDRTVMCVKHPSNVPVCMKNPTGCGIVYLQSSLKIPMCLVDEENGSLLEIKDDKVIFNQNMDFTNFNQHWYFYPDNKKDKAFTIVTRNEEKVLQLDELIVKRCDSLEEAVSWTILNGKKKWFTNDKTIKVYPMFRNCFMIRFQSYYLTWDLLTEKMVLSDAPNPSKPFDRQLWTLDMQPDGTFTLASCANNKKFLSNKDNNIVCCDFTYDGCQLWRQEGNFIKSESTHGGYLGTCSSVGDDNPAPPIAGANNEGVAKPEHDSATEKGPPSLVISCRATGNGDNKQLIRECVTTKVVIQVSHIVHQVANVNVALLSKNDSSGVSMFPCNCVRLLWRTDFWALDYQLDGTFFIISYPEQKFVLSCDSTTSTPEESILTMRELKGDESQLWSWDGDYIESAKFKDKVITVMPGSKTLHLSNKGASDQAQLFKQESYTPVLIRCLKDDTVLELDDTSVLKFSAVDESWPDSQVWYLKYSNGFINPSFMIISKKDGQALQYAGLNVETKDMDTTNEEQQWRRDGLFIVSQRKYLWMEKVMANSEGLKLVLDNRESNKSRYFEFQHIAVKSYDC